AGHCGRQPGEPGALLLLAELLDQLLALEIRLGMPLAEQALGFGRVGDTALIRFVQRRLGLDEPGTLGGEVPLLLDALARAVLAGMGGDEPLLGEALEIGLAGLRD